MEKENQQTFKKEKFIHQRLPSDSPFSNSIQTEPSKNESNIEIIMDYINTIKVLRNQVESLEAKHTEHFDNIKMLSDANMRLRKENKDLRQRVNELEQTGTVRERGSSANIYYFIMAYS